MEKITIRFKISKTKRLGYKDKGLAPSQFKISKTKSISLSRYSLRAFKISKTKRVRLVNRQNPDVGSK